MNLGNLFEELEEINWELVENYNILKKSEIYGLLRIVGIDHSGTISKMRQIIDQLVQFLYNSIKNTDNPRLSEMVKELSELQIISRKYKIYIDTLRLIGNIAIHEGGITQKDVEIISPLFILVVKLLTAKGLETELKKMKKKMK